MKSTWIALLTTLAILTFATRLEGQEVIFEANFENDLNSEEGEAPGNSFNLEFSAGLLGQGVLIKSASVLQYPVADNISSQNGTLSLWVKPNWNPGGILHRIFVLGNEPRNFELHVDENAALAFAVNTSQIEDKPIKVALANADYWQAGNWYFLTYTWNAEEIQIFVNGQSVGGSEVGFEIPLVTEENFHLGSLFGEEAFDGVIDQVKVYDSMLNPEEVSKEYENTLNQLPPASALKIIDLFGRDVSTSGITLVDWEGPISNPAMKYFLKGNDSLAYPLNITLSTEVEQCYFDLPSTVGKNGPQKSMIIESAESLDSFLMAFYMDKDYEDNSFDLTIQYINQGIPSRQLVPVRVIDQDYDRPLNYPVMVDFSLAIDSFLRDPMIQEVVVEAAEDWLYYIDGEGIDPIDIGESSLGVGGQDHNFEEQLVNNPVAYTGYYLFAYENTTELGPCFCSTGFPNVQELQTKDGQVVPIPRIGGLHLNKFGQDFGDVRPDGWEVSSPYENWTFEGFQETDLYSIAKHEIGHAMVFEELPLFDDAQNRLGFVSPALEAYYGTDIVPLYEESLAHLIRLLDPASLATPYGGGVEEPIMASGREMLTKLDVLIMESVGYPLRKNEVTRPLSLEADSDFLGSVNEPFSGALLARGGIPVYNFEIIEGALPEGLELNTRTGQINGTPTTIGEYPITFQVWDYNERGQGESLETSIQIASAGSFEAELISFNIDGQIGETEKDDSEMSLKVLMPNGSDITSIVPEIDISQEASISPEQGLAQDFTTPVNYTVRSENGAVANTWTVSVEVEMQSGVFDAGVMSFDIFPSPVINGVNLRFSLEETSDLSLKIYGINGQLIQTRNLGNTSYFNEWIDLSFLEAGLYQLLVSDRSKRLILKPLLKISN